MRVPARRHQLRKLEMAICRGIKASPVLSGLDRAYRAEKSSRQDCRRNARKAFRFRPIHRDGPPSPSTREWAENADGQPELGFPLRVGPRMTILSVATEDSGKGDSREYASRNPFSRYKKIAPSDESDGANRVLGWYGIQLEIQEKSPRSQTRYNRAKNWEMKQQFVCRKVENPLSGWNRQRATRLCSNDQEPVLV